MHYVISIHLFSTLHYPVMQIKNTNNILHTNKNNLCNAALYMRLPQWSFMLITPEKMTATEWIHFNVKTDKGFTLEVDHQYSEFIHGKL